MEEILNRNTKSIAQFFNGRDCRTVVASADDIVDRRLCNAAFYAQSIDGNILFFAQFNNPQANSLSYGNGRFLLSSQYVKKEYIIALAKVTSFELI